MRTPMKPVLAMLAMLFVPRDANAFPVFDAANVVQTTATAINTFNQLMRMKDQIDQTRAQLDNQLKSLRNLDPTSFNQVIALVNSGRLTYDQITGDVRNIGYTLQSINRDFDGLFPRDKDRWKNVRASDFDNHYAGWQGEINNSALATMRAQTSLGTVKEYNNQAAAILGRANGADGEVRQLQSMNQMLGVIQAQLNNLLQAITTVGHLTGELAAASASEKLMRREARSRRRDGYTNPGKPVNKLQKLP